MTELEAMAEMIAMLIDVESGHAGIALECQPIDQSSKKSVTFLIRTKSTKKIKYRITLEKV